MALICFLIQTECIDAEPIVLPEAGSREGMPLDSVLALRRSVREFSPEKVSLDEVARLLWAGQGITNEHGYRTAPSAGGLYPIDLYLFARAVDGLDTGVYRYIPETHTLNIISRRDIHEELGEAALDQEWVREAPVIIILAGAPEKTYVKYGDRAWRYVLIESGCVAQNILLESIGLRLASVIVGSFYDERIRPLLGIQPAVHPLAIICIGSQQE